MYYPSSENKGADQLRGYREADLRLCFRLGKNPVFSRCGSIYIVGVYFLSQVVILNASFNFENVNLHSGKLLFGDSGLKC